MNFPFEFETMNVGNNTLFNITKELKKCNKLKRPRDFKPNDEEICYQHNNEKYVGILWLVNFLISKSNPNQLLFLNWIAVMILSIYKNNDSRIENIHSEEQDKNLNEVLKKYSLECKNCEKSNFVYRKRKKKKIEELSQPFASEISTKFVKGFKYISEINGYNFVSLISIYFRRMKDELIQIIQQVIKKSNETINQSMVHDLINVFKKNWQIKK
jgi:CHASE3 domain sensor protein